MAVRLLERLAGIASAVVAAETMMNIQILSDLHLEFHPDRGKWFFSSLDATNVDVIVVAGDVSTSRLLRPAIQSLCTRYAEVVYVVGNHEYYHSSPQSVHDDLRSLRDALPNFHWLQNEVVEIAEVRFAGTTLWFRDQPTNPSYEHGLNDFELIRGFKPWVYEENEQALAFLETEASRADVVVTHHLPSKRSIAPCFEGDPLNRFFLCDVDALIQRAQPTLWIHGHTHESIDVRVGKTRILCNPHGYMTECNWDFRQNLVVRVGGGE
jgi:Icc-related predicted phosphoesterase